MDREVAHQRSVIFQPIVVLLFSLTIAASYGLYVLRSTQFKPSLFSLSGHFFYVVPIVVPFVAFLFDRVENYQASKPIKSIIDILVVGTAVGRLFAIVPLISGHTLFTTYALVTCRSRIVKISAGLVMLHTLYLKYIVWHDWVTSTSGIVFGLVAAFMTVRFGELRKEESHG